MDLTAEFTAAAAHAYDLETACPELVPMVLAEACVKVLPVAGAGLSITDKLRVPLGSSDSDAARAERLQTTLGEGPCLAATATEQALTAGLDAIAVRWPMFHRELVTQTPFRAVVALPLFSPRQRLRCGALDLYLTTPEASSFSGSFLSQVQSAIADPIATILFGSQPHKRGPAGDLPPWMSNFVVADRMHVWVAVGMLTEHAGVLNADALAALRAYAFSHNTTLDDIAHDLTTERLNPQALLA